MRKRLGYLLVATVVGGLGVAGTMAAEAEWVISGSGQVKMRAPSMPRGTTPSVAKQSSAAVVSWSAQELVPDVRMDHYVVTAHSADAPARPSISRTVAASGGATESVTLGADDVAGGRWYWTIVPRFALWAGDESGKSAELNFPATAKASPAATQAARAAPTATAATAATAAAPAEAAAPAATTEAAVVSGTMPAAVPRTSPAPGSTPGDSPPSSTGTAPSEQPPKPVEPSASDSAPADIPE
ncbi:hypothetical protein [Paractinoplanes atraurantiacus]|uniref:Uncharacterized protein n=1 Tax=Paractinoplanes atraurantiacus TaxID=1036182 RepID=A0A285F557_9ACTN|nr:hypothetical protein [Actinoplanes atraurantiacus]SNY06412.1 hypothetical protein SAMN05421748_101714 [Actinoplanes atraurantiacus]